MPSDDSVPVPDTARRVRSAPSTPARVRALLRARLAGSGDQATLPIAVLMVQAGIAAALCDVASDVLAPFPYGLFALSVSAALVALPLLGDLGAFLRADRAAEWIESLPVRASDLRVARTLHVLIALGVLSLASLVPAALLAPGSVDAVGRLSIVLAGLGQACALAALLLAVQSLLGGRAEPLLILAQTLLMLGVVVGTVVGLRLVPWLQGIASPADLTPAARWLLPPAWFASFLAPDGSAALAVIATPLALAVLVLLPAPAAPAARRASLIGRLLEPLRTLAVRFWVRRDERASFDLVYDGLPLEREFELRTYPLIAIPLAFLLVGARGESGAAREGLLALILFTPGAYLPVLLTHVPASASHHARWLLDTAPVASEAIAGGALKAVLLRFVTPLFALLIGLAWALEGPSFALRIGLPGFAVSTVVLRVLYGWCVAEPPLSTPPEEVAGRIDWFGPIAAVGIALTVLSIFAVQLIATPAQGLLAALTLWIAGLLYGRAAALRTALPGQR